MTEKKFPNSFPRSILALCREKRESTKRQEGWPKVSVTTIWVKRNGEQFRQLVFDLKDRGNADSNDIFKKTFDWNLPNCISLNYFASNLIFVLVCLLCHLFQGYLKWQPLFPLSKISKSLSWTMTSLDEMTLSVKPQLTWSRGYCLASTQPLDVRNFTPSESRLFLFRFCSALQNARP